MTRKHFLLVSDFDRTLSFNDSGHVLSEMLGISTVAEKVAGLSQLNLVQSGAEQEWDRVRTDWLTIRDGKRQATGTRG